MAVAVNLYLNWKACISEPTATCMSTTQPDCIFTTVTRQFRSVCPGFLREHMPQQTTKNQTRKTSTLTSLACHDGPCILTLPHNPLPWPSPAATCVEPTQPQDSNPKPALCVPRVAGSRQGKLQHDTCNKTRAAQEGHQVLSVC
jgi:hypothetical protein